MKKKAIIFIIFVLVLILGFFLVAKNKALSPVVEKVNEDGIRSLCYSYVKKTDRGYVDHVFLRLDIKGEKVTGEFNNNLAEKDSKVGTFEGTVGPVNPQAMSRRANVWWDSFAEGMRVTEELMIDFGEGSAQTVSGEDLADRGDGVYVYKDKTKLHYGLQLNQVDCEARDNAPLVEKYVRENIKIIAPNQPVLGGAWYVSSIFVFDEVKSGIVVYEDGHIQSTAFFEYQIEEGTGKINIKNFELKKD